jgi:Zn-dependent protease with chaperone function
MGTGGYRLMGGALIFSTFITVWFYAIVFLPILLTKGIHFRKYIYIDFVSIGVHWLYNSIIALLVSGILSWQSNGIFQSIVFNWVLGIIFSTSYFWTVHPILFLVRKTKFKRIPFFEEQIESIFEEKIKVVCIENGFINAFALGIFPNSRVIILGRTLLEQLTRGEQEAVLYHEYAHHKNKDVTRFLFFSSLALIVNMVGVTIIKEVAPAYGYSNLALLNSIWAGIYWGLCYTIVFSKISHKAEFRADTFSALRGGAENMIGSLRMLNKITDGLLEKGSMSHPDLKQRIENIRTSVPRN